MKNLTLPLEDQFYFDNKNYYPVDKIIDFSKNIKAKKIKVDLLFDKLPKKIFDMWCENLDYTNDFIHHTKRVILSDLKFPIIVFEDTNEICDGCHRLIKAKVLNKKTILVKYINKKDIKHLKLNKM